MNPKFTPQQQRELLEWRITRLRLEITAEHLRHHQQQSQQQNEWQWLTVLDALPSRHSVSRISALPIQGKHRLWLGIISWLWRQWLKRHSH